MSLLELWAHARATIPGVLLYPAVLTALFLLYNLAGAVYNIFLHPLRDYPGPLLSRASKLPWAYHHVRGDKPHWFKSLHDKYGTVVRVAPDFLTYTDSRAWKEIYGHRIGSEGGHPENPKSPIFTRIDKKAESSIIVADREEHSRLRRALSHGFSDRALREQEPLIMRHVEFLQQRLDERANGGKTALDMERWYNWTTFDIVGELVFAQDFGNLQNAAYDPFGRALFDGIRKGAKLSALTFLGFRPLVRLLIDAGATSSFKKLLDDHIGTRLKRRMESKEDCYDLIEGLLKRKEEWNLSFGKIRANATILALAGSETTATLLSGVTYLLLQHPEILAKLRQELDSSFQNAAEITMSSVLSLPYLQAVINEGLRRYPPVATGLIRHIPEGGVTIAGRFVPAGTQVEISQFAINHSKENFADPMVFRPERFLADAKDKDNLEAMQPFSYGPRNCIGMNLANAEMRVILARVAYRFDWKLAPEGENWFDRQHVFNIWDKPPLPVYFVPRKP